MCHCEGLFEAIEHVGIRCSLIATLALLARNDAKIMRSDSLVSLQALAKQSNGIESS